MDSSTSTRYDNIDIIAIDKQSPIKKHPIPTRKTEFGNIKKALGPRQAFYTAIIPNAKIIMIFLFIRAASQELKEAPTT